MTLNPPLELNIWEQKAVLPHLRNSQDTKINEALANQ